MKWLTRARGRYSLYQYFMLEAKSAVRRVLGISDPWKKMRDLEARIHPHTWDCQPKILQWLNAVQRNIGNHESPELYQSSSNPIVWRGYLLRKKLLQEYRGRLGQCSQIRVMIHLLPFTTAPGGYSLARNIGLAFEYLGVRVSYWNDCEPIAHHLDHFKPTVLLSFDTRLPSAHCLSGHMVDWEAIRQYRRQHSLAVGLAMRPYCENSVVLHSRLTDAYNLGVTFFYSYQTASFIQARQMLYREHGFPILSLEFGANPLLYYPVPIPCPCDLTYVLLASSNYEKLDRYCNYFLPLLEKHSGFLFGPGWSRGSGFQIPENLHRYVYARARIGLNLHVPFQIDSVSELNERTYNLAASGVVQLVDNPKLLCDYFGHNVLYVASNPREYFDLFHYILEHPDEARNRAMASMEVVFARHTVFHRVESFINALNSELFAS